jgi:DNA-binding XRE family transcriptional regulator
MRLYQIKEHKSWFAQMCKGRKRAMENSDDIRLIVKIAQLYYEQDMTQAQIARELGIYRTTISRLLKRGREQGSSPSPSITTTTRICGWSSS